MNIFKSASISNYDPERLQPMRDELVNLGVKELRTPEEVEQALLHTTGRTMVVVNSVCGCAGAAARPAIALALESAKRPANCFTVFAGQDKEATARTREIFGDIEPSSPSIAFLVNGKVEGFIHRTDIQGHTPEEVAAKLIAIFEAHV
ncbi:MAG: BrxA/BrxB family bacilliredoxin [bacterium]|nr:BrxA/BrxB family bacilliredoxin [bacterium]